MRESFINNDELKAEFWRHCERIGAILRESCGDTRAIEPSLRKVLQHVKNCTNHEEIFSPEFIKILNAGAERRFPAVIVEFCMADLRYQSVKVECEAILKDPSRAVNTPGIGFVLSAFRDD